VWAGLYLPPAFGEKSKQVEVASIVPQTLTPQFKCRPTNRSSGRGYAAVVLAGLGRRRIVHRFFQAFEDNDLEALKDVSAPGLVAYNLHP